MERERGTGLSRRLALSAAAGGLAGLPWLAATPARADDGAKPMLMFVQLADDMAIDPDAGTLRLVGVNPTTLYFADRPERIAGHVRMADFMTEWTSKAGPDNFGEDPPNAALSVYEPDQPDASLAIVEILNPKVEGSDLLYDYRLIEGAPPRSGGQTALFIDWIGPGGGVGVGFHGVGVGRRGPGFYR